MNKTIVIIIVTLVLLITGIVLMVFFQSSLTGLNEQSNSTQNQAECKYQAKRFCNGLIEESEIDPNCVREKYYEDVECDTGSAIAAVTGIPIEE